MLLILNLISRLWASEFFLNNVTGSELLTFTIILGLGIWLLGYGLINNAKKLLFAFLSVHFEFDNKVNFSLQIMRSSFEYCGRSKAYQFRRIIKMNFYLGA